MLVFAIVTWWPMFCHYVTNKISARHRTIKLRVRSVLHGVHNNNNNFV